MNTRTHGGRLASILAVIALLLMLAPVPPAAGQARARSFETPDGRYELEWGRGWDANIDDSDPFAATVTLQQEFSLLSVMFVSEDPGLGLEWFFDEFRDGFASAMEGPLDPVDQWETSTSMHSMETMEVDGLDLAFYFTIEEGRRGAGPVLMVFATPPTLFETSFETLQEEVTLNGDAVFDDDAPADLAAILAGGSATAREDRPGGASTSRPGSTVHERRTGDGIYEDTTYDYTVGYSGPWTPATPTAGSFMLQDASFNTVGFMGMPFSGSRSAFIDLMEESWQGSGGTYLGTVEDRDRVLMVTQVSGAGILAQEMIFLDASSAVLISVVLIGDTDAAVRSLRQHVEVNDEPVLQGWDDL